MFYTKCTSSNLRNPHALQSVRAPSGPRRHSGVSVVLQEWHFCPAILRL